jgi:hypothetical protein
VDSLPHKASFLSVGTILFFWAAKRALDSSVLKDRAGEVVGALWSIMKPAKKGKKEKKSRGSEQWGPVSDWRLCSETKR